jgi:hypothetical protein
MYRSTLSLISRLDSVGGQRYVPAALPPGKTRYSLCRRLGGPQCRMYMEVVDIVTTALERVKTLYVK